MAEEIMSGMSVLGRKALDIGLKLLKRPGVATPKQTEPTLPAEIFHYPDLKWAVVDMPANKTGGQDYHTTGIREKDGVKIATAVVADGIASKTDESRVVAQTRRYSHELAEKLLSGTPITEIEDHDLTNLKSFALTSLRITYPPEKETNYKMEVATHRDCFTAVLIPQFQDGKRSFACKVFPLTVQGLEAAQPESFPPGTIIFSGSDGSYHYLTEHVKGLYVDALTQKSSTTPLDNSYQLMWDTLTDNQQKFGMKMGREGITEDERCIRETLLLLQNITQPTEGHEEAFVDAIRKEIGRVVDKGGGRPHDDLTLLMTHLPRAQKESTTKDEKPRPIDEVRQEIVSAIEVVLKDEERSPTADGSANTGFNRHGDASLQCRHVWYGRDSRMMNIGAGEDAMVEGVTVNLDTMYNYYTEEFTKIEGSPAPSEQRTYFIPINPSYPVLVEHPTFIQRQLDITQEKLIRRVLPAEVVDKELESPVPFRRATEQDIRDVHVVVNQTIGMVDRAMHPRSEDE